MVDAKYVEKHYPLGKADLYAAFLLRGLELTQSGGTSSMLTMRNWMFIKQYAELRDYLLHSHALQGLGDFDRGAFEDVPDEVVSVVVSIFRKEMVWPCSIAVCPTPREDRSRDNERTQRKRAATICHITRYDFDPEDLGRVPGNPVVYWWGQELLELFDGHAISVKDQLKVRQGLATGDDARFILRPWEAGLGTYLAVAPSSQARRLSQRDSVKWCPYIKGAAGKRWFEPLDHLVRWDRHGLHKKVYSEYYGSRGGNGTPSESSYFLGGLIFSTMGAEFGGRLHRYASIFASTGCTVFGNDLESVCALFNSTLAQRILESFNPTIHFTNNDVERLPVLHISHAKEVIDCLNQSFGQHESHREPSIEFRSPGASTWRYSQTWAQLAVDCPNGVSLPTYEPVEDPEPPTDHLSYAVGIALGRFSPHDEGALDPTKDDLSNALPHGILFLDLTLDESDTRDDLGHPAAAPLQTAWRAYGQAIGGRHTRLREWLALDFFKDVHKGMYENRPIYWPLSSFNKTFVAIVNIHRMTEHTLPNLLADALSDAMRRLDGTLKDLRSAREGVDKKAAREAERQYERVVKARDELAAFMADVEQCANKGAPRTDPKCLLREQDIRYAPDLDDGVVINSAALWPLLEPQWKDPKKWWKELSTGEGKKDYDWSHLAMRNWPTRVDRKCQADPSLAVAHGCFWRYHPGRAWAWELRLQDEIGPDFRIEEAHYQPGGRDLGDDGDKPHRATWLRDHTREALAAVEREAERRMGRGRRRRQVPSVTILEPGLWSALPEEVWEMELRLSELQGCEFVLLAPDEPEARAAFEEEHPDMVNARLDFVASLEPVPGLYDAGGGEDEDGADAGEDEDALDADEEDAA